MRLARPAGYSRMFLLILVLFALRARSMADFKITQVISPAEYPGGVTVTDLNQDGYPDFIVLQVLPRTIITIYWGAGDGTFVVGPSYDAPFGLQTVTTADLNLDGKPDVITANGNLYPGIGNITVFMNNGDGTLAAPVGYRVGQEPHDVAVGDINEDGIPDLAVAFGAYAGRAGTSVLFGKGDGTFFPKRTYGGARRWPQNLVLADFNRDGHLDLMESSVSRDITVRLGNGDGTFGPSHKIVLNNDTALYIRSLAVADYNGDGIPDVAVAISANVGGVPSGYVIMTGRGDGSFTFLGNYTHSLFISQLATVDLNQDGLPDLALTDQFGTMFLLNDGHGMFVNGGTFGVPTTSTTLADLNGDGLVDMIQSDYPGQKITVLLNTGW